MTSSLPSVASSPTFRLPRLDGSQNILEIIEDHAIHSREHPVFRYEDEGSVKIILWGEVVRAYHIATRHIQRQLDIRDLSSPAPVIGILATLDTLTYASLIVGIMRAGFVPFPISNRNSPAAISHLLGITGCRHVFVSEDPVTRKLAKAAVTLWQETSPRKDQIALLSTPNFDQLFVKSDEDDKPLLPLRKIEKTTTCIILHSSGSIAFPKAITLTYHMVFEHGLTPYYGEVDLCGHVFSGQPVPMYHLMGFIIIPWTAMLGITIAVFPPKGTWIPSPDLVLSSAVATGCTLLYCVPAFLENWARKEGIIEVLKKFTAVLYAGGPLATSVGDMLTREGISIVPMFGLTEVGATSMIVPKEPPKEGWYWFRTSPIVNTAFLPIDGYDDVFRMVIKESSLKTPAVINTTVDGVRAYDTNDLVIRHPTNPNLWKVYGRFDDIIMHSTGEKTNPIPIEEVLMKNPKISSAIMFGRSKFQAGVLILPTKDYLFDPTDIKKLEAYRNLVWESVVLANETAPQHSRIYKEMILVANPAKPFEYTAKGTPRRQTVLNSYAPEIEDIYKAAEDSSNSEISPPQVWELGEITRFIHAVVKNVLGQEVSATQDIFAIGADSLAATSIRNSVLRALRHSKSVPTPCVRAMPTDLAYMFPSVSALSSFIYGAVLVSRSSLQPGGTLGGNQVDDEKEFNLPPAYTGPTLLKMREGNGGPPLISIHGMFGKITQFLPMRERFRSALWAIQMTSETPLTSLSDLAKFYVGKIKEQQPHGPYRLAGYSGASLLTLLIVKSLEEQGEEILQFAMLDHFPTIYLDLVDPNTFNPTDPEQRKAALQRFFASFDSMLRHGDSPDAVVRRKRADELLSGVQGHACSSEVQMNIKALEFMSLAALDILFGEEFFQRGAGKNEWSFELLRRWMQAIKAPVEIYVASEGIAALNHRENPGDDEDLGARAVFPFARIILVEGDHYSFLAEENFIQHVQGRFLDL